MNKHKQTVNPGKFQKREKPTFKRVNNGEFYEGYLRAILRDTKMQRFKKKDQTTRMFTAKSDHQARATQVSQSS